MLEIDGITVEAEPDVVRFFFPEQTISVTAEVLPKSMAFISGGALGVKLPSMMSISADGFRILMQHFGYSMLMLAMDDGADGNKNGAAALVVWT